MKKILIYFFAFFIATTTFAQSNPDNDVKTFVSYNISPEFPGGLMKFFLFVYENLKYPKDARKKKLEGIVTVSFIIDTLGFVDPESIKIERSLNESCDQEVIRVIKKSPKWYPAYSNGKVVRMRVKEIPIAFKLDN